MGDSVNPGSRLGEAIGTLLEREIHQILRPIVEEKGCVYLTVGGINPKTGRHRKLVIADSDGNHYEVDSVIANRHLQPLVLVESKYIRYKKHNRDKGSWICTAHTKLREKYSTVRKSIAILMGSWSHPSKRLLQSFGIDLFEIPFEVICDVLEDYQINLNWGEKQRDIALQSCERYFQLPLDDQAQIGKRLIATVAGSLRETIESTLEQGIPKRIRTIKVLIQNNLGETYTYSFVNLSQALVFLQSYEASRDMDNANAPTLLLE